jgi:hypothetical protein
VWKGANPEPLVQGGAPPPAFSNVKRPEFRYGREEMLDIFHREIKPPEDLTSLGSLYVDSCQMPLNLTQVGALDRYGTSSCFSIISFSHVCI